MAITARLTRRPREAMASLAVCQNPELTLIEEVCRRARAAGSPRVYWQTHETNSTAMLLYDKVAEKSGFVVYRKML